MIRMCFFRSLQNQSSKCVQGILCGSFSNKAGRHLEFAFWIKSFGLTAISLQISGPMSGLRLEGPYPRRDFGQP